MHPTAKIETLEYNAASGQFDALVTVIDPSGRVSYAISLDAPITAEFDHIIKQMLSRAKDLHRSGATLHLSKSKRPKLKSIDNTAVGVQAARITAALFARLAGSPKAA